MSDQYGVQSTGYARTPLSVILSDIEQDMIDVFGPGVIQTSQSPLGQLNGLMADLIAEIDERNLDIYQSYDPDQAEGVRLNILARIRLLQQGEMNEPDFRKSITNEAVSNFELADFETALKSLNGVVYAKVWVNEVGKIYNPGSEPGSFSISILGGEDSEIARIIQKFSPPGVLTSGDVQVTTSVDGYCRNYTITRPVETWLNLTINVRRFSTGDGCPAPSRSSVALAIQNGWAESRLNDQEPNFFNVRKIVEKSIQGVEILSVNWGKLATPSEINPEITFGEIGLITSENIMVVDS